MGLALAAALLAACTDDVSAPGGGAAGSGGGQGSAEAPPNILLVVADDLGVDASVCYDVGADPGRAPHVEELCARGVVFQNAWAAPTCSPTRATILTGRHGFRTGVGAQIVGDDSAALGLDEVTLPGALEAGAEATYAAACIGKWHLSTSANGGADHPNLAGFSHYAGSLDGALPSYTSWPRTVDGQTATAFGYATSVQVDDALAWVTAQSRPWLLWLAFNAPHSPFHVPPADLQHYDDLDPSAPVPDRPVEHYHAMIEAMDTELGRLLDGLGPDVVDNTWIVFVGDNGTPGKVAGPPVTPGRAKDSLYQGGIHVPLVVAGPGVASGGRVVDALVSTVDLFASVLDLASADRAKAVPAGVTIDSVSLVPYLLNADQPPARSWAFSEQFDSTTRPEQNGKTIRDDAFKLIRFDDGRSELYDLRVDPDEGSDLLSSGAPSDEAATHREALEAELDALLASP